MNCRTKPWRGLVVDDVPAYSRAIGIALSRLGGQITIAQNGAEAIDILRVTSRYSLEFQIVFTDVQMPIMDGIEAALEMRRMGFLAPIVAITGCEEPHIADRCLAAGCNEFLRKPASLDELTKVVTRYFQPSPQLALAPV